MTLSTLLVCADADLVDVLQRALEELGMKVELCADYTRAGVRLAQERYDLTVLNCKTQREAVQLLLSSRSSRLNESTLSVVVVEGHEAVREMFLLGVNFVLYKPVSYERALSSVRAARTLLLKDKRRKARAVVHTHATIDYAGGTPEKATLVDLAENGMAVKFGKRFPPASKIYFQFQLPGQKSPVRLSGQVMWQEWDGRAGVEFVDVPQTSRRLVTEWLQNHLNDANNSTLARHAINVGHSDQPLVAPAVAPLTEKQGETAHERDAVARLRAKSFNRRGQDRHSCRLGAEVFQSGRSVRNYCHLSDLSPGGCYLEMPVVFPQGSAVEITVRTHEIKLRLSGNVKASNPGHGMGISFKLNTDAERGGVQQLIDFVAAAAPSSE
jgi:CheY-like chemotaxis protein